MSNLPYPNALFPFSTEQKKELIKWQESFFGPPDANFGLAVMALFAWGDALAAKLNADAGVSDTDFVGPSP
jgi:hypothetical protein